MPIVKDSITFADDAVPLDLLRQRAFNLRWAEQPADVIPLTAADPDFPVCDVIREELVRYVRDGVLSYGPPQGLPHFRQAVADWIKTSRHIDCGADCIFATDSAASGMALVARASLNRGDEVLIPDPVDFLFQHTVERTGAIAVRVPITATTAAEEFIAGMASRLTERTRMLWLCNPHNPLGVVYSWEWLRPVCEWAMDKGLRVLSDEIWADIVYSPHRHASVAALSPEIARNTITVYGFSKNFGLAGLRVGCLISSDPEWLQQIMAISDASSTVYGVSVLSQRAAIAAVTQGRMWLNEFVSHLRRQRDFVLERLSRWPDVTVYSPQGTYVVFPCISKLAPDAERFCEVLHEHARVALVPGAPRWFGPGARGHVRICFASSRAILADAFDRMDQVMAKFQRRS